MTTVLVQFISDKKINFPTYPRRFWEWVREV